MDNNNNIIMVTKYRTAYFPLKRSIVIRPIVQYRPYDPSFFSMLFTHDNIVHYCTLYLVVHSSAHFGLYSINVL